jgi:predicted P-loop ATPase
MLDLARDNPYHPVRDELHQHEQAWDGKTRLDTWLIDCLGAEDTPYVRAVGRLSLIGAVRRVRDPGCELQTMVILEGPQGIGKSKALAILAGRPEWFNDRIPLGSRDKSDLAEALEGTWVAEVAELSTMHKADVETVKTEVSRRYDKVRRPYERKRSDVARQCSLWGTVNPDVAMGGAYLKDRTGNRRFLPVRCGTIDLDALVCDRAQLLGEAAWLERQGESHILTRELWAAAAAEQDERLVDDHHPWEDMIGDVIGDGQGKVRASDVLTTVIGLTPGEINQRHLTEVGKALRKLGFERRKLGAEWFFVRGDLRNGVPTELIKLRPWQSPHF